MTWIRSILFGGRIRSRGRLMSIVLIVLVSVTVQHFEPLRPRVFDSYQRLYPRIRQSTQVEIVAIDEKSLRYHGQWPWPRIWLAQLVNRIAAAPPSAIGIDILMPEPDRLSPARLPEILTGIDSAMATRLASLPSNDTILAHALRDRPVVVAMAGLDRHAEDSAPQRSVQSSGGDPASFVWRFGGALRSLEEIERAAAGHGLINLGSEGGTVRRMPLVATVGGRLVPAFGIELLRVAGQGSKLSVRVGATGIEAVDVGKFVVPTEPDGTVWIRYSRSIPAHFVSAADVLAGQVPPYRFMGRVVLVGVTALGLSDDNTTPVGDLMSGVEIHAQLLDSIFDGDLLLRPRSALWIELGLVLLVGVAMVYVFDRAPVSVSVVAVVTLLVVPVGVALALFLRYGLLVDPVAAIVAVLALLGQQSFEKFHRLARLKRFFSPQLAELIVEGGTADPLTSHRREVTVVFLDLRGFTAFADTTNPEEVMGVLHEYQTEMGQLILNYEGTLERFTGDGMMIFFNDPVPMADATERAVRMAHAMRERVRELDVRWRQCGYGLGFGIGIAQGEATLGAIGFEGRWDYAAIGTVTNLAARLCSEARSEQILVSQGLAEAVREFASIEALGPVTLKGFARSLPVFNILTLKSPA